MAKTKIKKKTEPADVTRKNDSAKDDKTIPPHYDTRNNDSEQNLNVEVSTTNIPDSLQTDSRPK